jgi:flagellar operon protein
MTHRTNLHRTNSVGTTYQNQQVTKKKGNQEFQRILNESLQRGTGLKISDHARERMEQRNITLSQQDLGKLETAIDSLERKGASESLMIYKDYAFIASVRNRTIITSMDHNEVDVITNIDSAVIIKE